MEDYEYGHEPLEEENSYDMEDVALNHELDNMVFDTEYTTKNMASSLFTASEMVGHNNKILREAVGVAQQLVGNTENLANDLIPFEVGSEAYVECNNYLQNLKQVSKVHVSQSKSLGEEATTYRDIDRLINSVGTAEDYSKVVF